MVNTSIDAIRRRKATGLVLGEAKSFEDVVDDGVEDDNDDEYSFTVKDVQSAMAKLSPMYRAVFNLYVFDNLTHQEIALKLGINVGTSKSNLAKARRNLRKILTEKKPDNV